ncbi:MAG: hypothetical protein LC797_15885 [Chloroflexi bacterium]|nr:hypothetical protein [Chloroflexota bacterium]
MSGHAQLDLEAQRKVRFSGLPGIWPQDSACQESMGAIYDRSSEHLVLPRADDWVESSREFRAARPGLNFAAT